MKTFLEWMNENIQNPVQKPVQNTTQAPLQNPAQQPVQNTAQKPAQNPQVEQLRKDLNGWMNEDQGFANPVDRKSFQGKVWSYISKNMKAIMSDMGDSGNGDYPAAPYAAWVLVQHMDAYPDHQAEFLRNLPANHVKYQFLKDRVAVNEKIRQFAASGQNGCDDPRFNGDPVSGVRDTRIFPDTNTRSAQEALKSAEQQGNTCLVAAVRAAGAKTQPSYRS